MKFILSCYVILILSSCQSSKELHFFKQDKNYYRLKINEHAFLSSSRYISGYYDEHALDNYFGEIYRKTADTNGNFQSLNVDGTAKRGSDSVNVKPDNTKLMFILSTDAKALSDQIGSFAQNEQTLEILARLSNKEVIKQNQELKNNISEITQHGQLISSFGTGVFTRIDTSAVTRADSGNVSKEILALLNYIGAINGVRIPFTTIKDAYNWYINNLSKN